MAKKKSANDVTLISSWSNKNKYTGKHALQITEELFKNWKISEKDLALKLQVDVGRKSSGVGDVKRLVQAILELGWDFTEKRSRPDK